MQLPRQQQQQQQQQQPLCSRSLCQAGRCMGKHPRTGRKTPAWGPDFFPHPPFSGPCNSTDTSEPPHSDDRLPLIATTPLPPPCSASVCAPRTCAAHHRHRTCHCDAAFTHGRSGFGAEPPGVMGRHSEGAMHKTTDLKKLRHRQERSCPQPARQCRRLGSLPQPLPNLRLLPRYLSPRNPGPAGGGDGGRGSFEGWLIA